MNSLEQKPPFSREPVFPTDNAEELEARQTADIFAINGLFVSEYNDEGEKIGATLEDRCVVNGEVETHQANDMIKLIGRLFADMRASGKEYDIEFLRKMEVVCKRFNTQEKDDRFTALGEYADKLGIMIARIELETAKLNGDLSELIEVKKIADARESLQAQFPDFKGDF